MTALYQTPTGQLMLDKLPEISRNTMEATQAILMAQMPAFQQKLMSGMLELQKALPPGPAAP